MNDWKVTNDELDKLEDGAGCDVYTYATPAEVEWIIAGAKLAQRKLLKYLDDRTIPAHADPGYTYDSFEILGIDISSEDWIAMREAVGVTL